MDAKERSNDYFEALRTAMDGREASTWQGGPGIIQSFNPDEMTCVVQPSIQGRVTTPAGKTSFVNMPLLLDVPVVFQGGGGMTLTFPITQGDECFFSIADRCIDAWWQQGGIQPPMEARMHDLSDAFAFVGLRSVPRALSNISTTSAQLRSDDGKLVIDANPTKHTLALTAPGGATITANVGITGNLHVTGTITSDTDVVTGSISLKNHVHFGVQSGSSITGAATG